MIVVLGELGGTDEYSLVEVRRRTRRKRKKKRSGRALLFFSPRFPRRRLFLFPFVFFSVFFPIVFRPSPLDARESLTLADASSSSNTPSPSRQLKKKQALESGKVTKPVVAWVSGTCAKMFKSEVQFGHAGARGGGADDESAQAKNAALAKAGAVVPESFEGLEAAVKKTYDALVASGALVPAADAVAVPSVPLDLDAAVKRGLVRAPTNIVSTICDDRGEEPTYCGERAFCSFRFCFGSFEPPRRRPLSSPALYLSGPISHETPSPMFPSPANQSRKTNPRHPQNQTKTKNETKTR